MCERSGPSGEGSCRRLGLDAADDGVALEVGLLRGRSLRRLERDGREESEGEEDGAHRGRSGGGESGTALTSRSPGPRRLAGTDRSA